MKHSKLLFAIFTLFLLLGTTNTAFAQPGQNQRPNKGKVTQLKIAYFTKELDLTTEQAEKFWPLYNEMTDKIRDKKKAGRQAASQLKDNSELTEEEAKAEMLAALNTEIDQAKLRKEYTEKIAAVIGYKKTAKLLSLEAEFKRELLKRLATDEPAESEPDE